MLQEREYRFHYQKLKRADQTCFIFLDCLKASKIKNPIIKYKDRDILKNVRFTQRRMVEKMYKTLKNYETFLLNNMDSIHYNYLHIKFAVLLDDIMKNLKGPLRMIKKGFMETYFIIYPRHLKDVRMKKRFTFMVCHVLNKLIFMIAYCTLSIAWRFFIFLYKKR